jgi:uncharacterized repeat protein (TIGR03943 family)
VRIGTGFSRTLLLAAWSALFAVLWALDEGQRYLGPRTQWVIPFGAIAETAGSLALLLPILVLVAVPHPELTAQAATKKRASNEILLAQLPGSGRESTAASATTDAPFVDVAVATLSPTEGAAMGLRPGARVRVHGLVVHDTGVPDTYGLARFFVSCCAADALPILVPVESRSTATTPDQDQWLLVSGRLARRGTRLIVMPTDVTKTATPSDPYLTADDGGAPPRASSVAASAPTRTPGTIFVDGSQAGAIPDTSTSAPAATGREAGYSGRAARVFDDFYSHCTQYTYEALAYPQPVRDAAESARLFVGQPSRFRKAAFDGCLAGLQAGEATITVQSLVQGALSETPTDRRSPGAPRG